MNQLKHDVILKVKGKEVKSVFTLSVEAKLGNELLKDSDKIALIG